MQSFSKESKAVELKGSRDEIYARINANKEAEEFFLKTKPSVMMLALLLNQTRIKKLYVSEGVSRTMPPRVTENLGKSVQLEILRCSRGRPQKYSETEIKAALSSGKSNDELMKELGMPRRTYFYWKKKLKNNGHGKG